jgi:hypothetical protein
MMIGLRNMVREKNVMDIVVKNSKGVLFTPPNYGPKRTTIFFQKSLTVWCLRIAKSKKTSIIANTNPEVFSITTALTSSQNTVIKFARNQPS